MRTCKVRNNFTKNTVFHVFRNHANTLKAVIQPNIKKNKNKITCLNTKKNLNDKHYILPSLDLLFSSNNNKSVIYSCYSQMFAKLIESSLASYRIKASVVNIFTGPTVTRFELHLAPGVKVVRISNIVRDLARSLSVTSVRVIDIIPGKSCVGLEIPNDKRQTVYLRDIISCDEFSNSISPLTIVLGKNMIGSPVIADLIKMPHLLIAGTTGSGKSMSINAMILSILYKSTPETVRLILIDPKMLELSIYQGIPHLLVEIITDMKDVINIFNWCIKEMEFRYRLMSFLNVRNLSDYNECIMKSIHIKCPIKNPWYNHENNSILSSGIYLCKLPYIIIFIDEFADLMLTLRKQVELLIIRLAQKSRAAGIHLILSTQRPSVNVITGIIKANIPSRIAFSVLSKLDSRIILDQNGAEMLLGQGDMLYLAFGNFIPMRIQGVYIHSKEIQMVVHHWKM